MSLETLVGKLSRRLPGFGVSVELKSIYVTYTFLCKPNIELSKKKIFIRNDMVIENFVTLLDQYGFSNLKEWNLYIDARDDWWMPHIEMPEALDLFNTMFKEVFVSCNSVFDTSDIKYNIEIHPTYSANLLNYYDDLQEANINFKDIELDKHFIVLARRPTRKRVLLVKDILDRFYNITRATCGNRWDINHKKQYELVGSNPRDDKKSLYWQYYDNIQDKKDVSIDDVGHTNTYRIPRVIKEKIHYKDLFKPYSYPWTLDEVVVSKDKQHKAPDNRFFSAIINLVCETTEDDHHPINLSEKTFKAFAWHQIPIWHSKEGTASVVRNLGFDLFDDIIDHSYDLESNYVGRKELILNELDRFRLKYPTNDSINELRKNLYTRLEANNRLLAKYVSDERILDASNLFKR